MNIYELGTVHKLRKSQFSNATCPGRNLKMNELICNFLQDTGSSLSNSYIPGMDITVPYIPICCIPNPKNEYCYCYILRPGLCLCAYSS